jgi:hypothetical protein
MIVPRSALILRIFGTAGVSIPKIYVEQQGEVSHQEHVFKFLMAAPGTQRA